MTRWTGQSLSVSALLVAPVHSFDCDIWNDVLSRVAGWLRIPDETTFGRILRTFTQKNINEMESLNRVSSGIWRKALAKWDKQNNGVFVL